MKTLLSLTLLCSLAIGCSTLPSSSDKMTANPANESKSEILLMSEVDWEKLNPARGDKSPQAGTLWGDRRGYVPTGFLAKFVDGFSSPPHFHNATYRAVVISGNIHNDDPAAAEMWMPPGSFWTQPKGEVHITSAKGSTNIAFVEIDKGPYLVLPPEEEFGSGEWPINVHASNIVWVDLPGMTASKNGPQIAYLWGSLAKGHSNGTFIKLPAGFDGHIESQGSIFRAVVIKGLPNYMEEDTKVLEPGSYFGSQGHFTHQVSSQTMESVIYINTNGKYEVINRQ